jgi:hypothetical protein
MKEEHTKTEGKIWKLVNKERKRRVKLDQEISLKENILWERIIIY